MKLKLHRVSSRGVAGTEALRVVSGGVLGRLGMMLSTRSRSASVPSITLRVLGGKTWYVGGAGGHGASPLAASRLRRRVSAALRDASFRASGLRAASALRMAAPRSSRVRL